jgi:hypothetical protein
MTSNRSELNASSPKQFTWDQPAKVREYVEYRLKFAALIVGFVSRACTDLWKLSRILYRYVQAPTIIHDSSNFQKCLNLFTSFGIALF